MLIYIYIYIDRERERELLKKLLWHRSNDFASIKLGNVRALGLDFVSLYDPVFGDDVRAFSEKIGPVLPVI